MTKEEFLRTKQGFAWLRRMTPNMHRANRRDHKRWLLNPPKYVKKFINGDSEGIAGFKLERVKEWIQLNVELEKAMTEIEIDYKPKIFDDLEYCESYDGECKFLTAVKDQCSLFENCDIGNMNDPSDFPKKHQQCIKYFKKAKNENS